MRSDDVSVVLGTRVSYKRTSNVLASCSPVARSLKLVAPPNAVRRPGMVKSRSDELKGATEYLRTWQKGLDNDGHLIGRETEHHADEPP